MKSPNEDGYDDPSNWWIGIFYFNPKDKRLFPPKRIGIGWTINFGNSGSVITFFAIIIIVILITKVLKEG